MRGQGSPLYFFIGDTVESLSIGIHLYRKFLIIDILFSEHSYIELQRKNGVSEVPGADLRGVPPVLAPFCLQRKGLCSRIFAQTGRLTVCGHLSTTLSL